jgi:hypothetical protein
VRRGSKPQELDARPQHSLGLADVLVVELEGATLLLRPLDLVGRRLGARLMPPLVEREDRLLAVG